MERRRDLQYLPMAKKNTHHDVNGDPLVSQNSHSYLTIRRSSLFLLGVDRDH